MTFLILASLLFGTAEAKDAILFVNMNYSDRELTALEEFARKSGQELVVVPPKATISEAHAIERESKFLKREIERAFRNKEEAAEVFNRLTVDIPQDQRMDSGRGPDLSRVPEAVKRRALELKKRQKEFKTKVLGEGSFVDLVAEAAQKIKAKGMRIDRFVASAHSEGISLFGETGLSLGETEFKELALRAPEVFQDPRHVLLMGCYTGTPLAKEQWRTLFPNSTMITGFKGQAPSRHFPASWRMISEILSTADRLDEKTFKGDDVEKADLIRALRKLKNLRLTSATVSYCDHEVTVAGRRRTSCKEDWEAFKVAAQQMEQVYLSPMPKLDPPRQTSGTPLRAFYNQLQALCNPNDEEMLTHRNELRNRVLRTIFWWTVQANFQKAHHGGIQRLKEEAKEIGLEFNVPDLHGQVGRIKFNSSFFDLNQQLHLAAEKARKEGDTGKEQKIIAFRVQFNAIYEPLLRLDNPEKIPSAWVE